MRELNFSRRRIQEPEKHHVIATNLQPTKEETTMVRAGKVYMQGKPREGPNQASGRETAGGRQGRSGAVRCSLLFLGFFTSKTGGNGGGQVSRPSGRHGMDASHTPRAGVQKDGKGGIQTNEWLRSRRKEMVCARAEPLHKVFGKIARKPNTDTCSSRAV